MSEEKQLMSNNYNIYNYSTHEVYKPSDFEQGDNSQLAILVCEYDLAICKICGVGEMALFEASCKEVIKGGN